MEKHSTEKEIDSIWYHCVDNVFLLLMTSMILSLKLIGNFYFWILFNQIFYRFLSFIALNFSIPPCLPSFSNKSMRWKCCSIFCAMKPNWKAKTKTKVVNRTKNDYWCTGGKHIIVQKSLLHLLYLNFFQ